VSGSERLTLKWRKRPVVVEAVQFDGTLASVEALHIPEASQDLGSRTLQIPTLEGVMTAQPGDWIIRGVQGEFYPCKPDIFEATYEPAYTPARDEAAELRAENAELRAAGHQSVRLIEWLSSREGTALEDAAEAEALVNRLRAALAASEGQP